MEITNILIAGVGGQGLVLTTDIISLAAFLNGYEVATNDVIGLAQRGGRVSGSVRFGGSVRTPHVPPGTFQILLGLEQLETLRFVHEVPPGGTVLMNRKVIYPNPVLLEKAEYPDDIEEQIQRRDVKLFTLDSDREARSIGKIRVANTVLIGALSILIEIDSENFMKAIEAKVPKDTVQANLTAFQRGRAIMEALQVDKNHSVPI